MADEDTHRLELELAAGRLEAAIELTRRYRRDGNDGALATLGQALAGPAIAPVVALAERLEDRQKPKGWLGCIETLERRVASGPAHGIVPLTLIGLGATAAVFEAEYRGRRCAWKVPFGWWWLFYNLRFHLDEIRPHLGPAPLALHGNPSLMFTLYWAEIREEHADEVVAASLRWLGSLPDPSPILAPFALVVLDDATTGLFDLLGPSLVEEMTGSSPIEDPRRVIADLARALGAAHAAGVHHGDLKLEHVFRMDDEVVLIDPAPDIAAPDSEWIDEPRWAGSLGYVLSPMADGEWRDLEALASCAARLLGCDLDWENTDELWASSVSGFGVWNGRTHDGLEAEIARLNDALSSLPPWIRPWFDNLYASAGFGPRGPRQIPKRVSNFVPKMIAGLAELAAGGSPTLPPPFDPDHVPVPRRNVLRRLTTWLKGS